MFVGQHFRKNVYQHQVKIQECKVRPEGPIILGQLDPFQLVGMFLGGWRGGGNSAFNPA